MNGALLDKATLMACISALNAREKECEKNGLSTRHWSVPKERCKSALLDLAADELKAQTPAFLQRQIG